MHMNLSSSMCMHSHGQLLKAFGNYPWPRMA